MSKEIHKMMGMYMVCKNETKPNFEINPSNLFGTHITYEGKPINAFFHSNSGGATETVANVWGGTNLPYLQTVATSRRRCIYTI